MIIDINDIPDLRVVNKTSTSLVIGGNVSLTVAMEMFEKYSKSADFEYLQHLAKHIDLIASVPVRNVSKCNYAYDDYKSSISDKILYLRLDP